MKIVQITPSLLYGDAVGNDVLAIHKILQECGYNAEIYAGNTDKRIPNNIARNAKDIHNFSKDDILIYHGATDSKLNQDFLKYTGKKVLIYHNITPPSFFEGYSEETVRMQQRAYNGIQNMVNKVNLCIADSEYNKNDLLKMGFTCPIKVCPIIIPFEDYDRIPNSKIIKRYKDDKILNLIFVGRIAPNKKQEDVIKAFFCYQKIYNPKSRLFLVGSNTGMERYDAELKNYANMLGLDNKVVFTGHIKFDEILAYYHLSDVFLCMSEHEGFCVPIAEAIYMKKKIVAYNSSAVPETMAGCGLMLDNKNPRLAASAINKITKDKELNKYFSEMQKHRLEELGYSEVKKTFLSCLKNLM